VADEAFAAPVRGDTWVRASVASLLLLELLAVAKVLAAPAARAVDRAVDDDDEPFVAADAVLGDTGNPDFLADDDVLALALEEVEVAEGFKFPSLRVPAFRLSFDADELDDDLLPVFAATAVPPLTGVDVLAPPFLATSNILLRSGVPVGALSDADAVELVRLDAELDLLDPTDFSPSENDEPYLDPFLSRGLPPAVPDSTLVSLGLTSGMSAS
jgi:hypothetical protein